MTSLRLSRRAVLLTLPAALALAACSSSTAGSGSPMSSPSPSASSSSSPVSGSSVSASQLATRLVAGVRSLTSARLALNGTAAGQRITGSGSEQLRNGKVLAVQLTESLPTTGSIGVVMVHGTSYLHLPSMLTKGKPWLLVSKTSSNPAARAAATAITSSGASTASPSSVTSFVSSAKSVTDLGSSTVRGARATHYRVIVELSKLPLAGALKSVAQQAGVNDIPVDLYVDGQNRPVRFTEDFSVKGQHIDFGTDLYDFDKPVTISAPPADQIQR